MNQNLKQLCNLLEFLYGMDISKQTHKLPLNLKSVINLKRFQCYSRVCMMRTTNVTGTLLTIHYNGVKIAQLFSTHFELSVFLTVIIL